MRTSTEERIRDHRARGWWSDLRITDMFDAAARAVPKRLAVIDPPNRPALTGERALRLTFSALSILADRYSMRLLELGFVRDDILISQLPNVAEYVALYIAAARLGVILSPVPMQFQRHELEQIASLTEARGAVTVPSFKGVQPAAITPPRGARRDFAVLCIGGDQLTGTTDFSEASLGASPGKALRRHVRQYPVSADDIVTICWTSGTEGSPKGVPRSHNHWTALSHAHYRAAGIRPGDRLLNPFPLVNMAAIGGCFMSWLHAAGTLVLHHPLDITVYLRQITEEKPHYAIAPPALLNMLHQDPNLLAAVDLSSLRCIGSGSAPLDPQMISGFHDRFGIEIANMFGSNEGMTLFSNAAYAPDPARRARFFPRFGRAEVDWSPPSPAVMETRLVDAESGREVLEPGRSGEMQMRGPTVFDGYFRAPELTASAFTADGFFRTGDLFQIAGTGDDLRFYQYLGRLRQIINRGGVKISPEELDEVLGRHPSILEAAITGYPDDVLGERICAVIVLRSGASLTLEAVREHFAASGLAIFKRPDRLRVVTLLPRNSIGKVIRTELAEIARDAA